MGSLTLSGLTAPPSTTHSFADYTSGGPLYFRIENQDTEATDYTLISHINYLTRDYMVGGLFSLLPVHIFMDNQDTSSLSVKAYGPALNKAALDIFYPKVTDVRISMTIILRVNNSKNLKDSDDSLQMIKYCGDSVLKSHGYRLTEDHFSVSAQNYIDSQQLRQFTLSLADASSSHHQAIDRQSGLSVTVKVAVDLYEDVDFDAVASFVDYSPSAAVPASMAGSRSMRDSMAACWLVSILTGVFVIGVLVAVYAVAGKMARRYVNVSGGGVGIGRVLEMAENDDLKSGGNDMTV